MDWFRWHHGSVNDPKFQLVAKQAGASVAEVIAVWACLLEAASIAADRGNPGSPDFAATDCALGFEDGKSLRIYQRMSDRDLLDEEGRISSWEKRQPKRERDDDNSTERSRIHRAKQRQATPSNASDDTETPRGDKRREEEDSVPTGTGGKPPAEMSKTELWEAGKSVLSQDGLAQKQCGSFVGALVKQYGEVVVLDAVRATVLHGPAGAREYLKATCQRLAGERKDPPKPVTVKSDAAERTAEMLAAQSRHNAEAVSGVAVGAKVADIKARLLGAI